MSKYFYVLVILIIAGCAKSNELELRPFNSDGCSLFPDKALIIKEDWCECCFEHDMKYWRGGTEKERLQADSELMECIFEKTGDENLAKLMYHGVRFGGSPYFYNWYRWGYGWSYDRKYRALNEVELEMVSKGLNEYYRRPQSGPCKEDG